MSCLPLCLVVVAAACSRQDRAEAPPRPQAPAPVAVAALADAAPVLGPASAAGPASPAGIEAMAAGTYDFEPYTRSHAYVLEVTGAVEDPSGRTKGQPRVTKTHCGEAAKAALVATAKAMVERAKKYGNPIECDHTYVTTPDPTFGALPATSTIGARPGHRFQYAVCTQAGVAEYDRTLQLYFNAPRLEVFGILNTEVGSTLADEDLAVLDQGNMGQIVRCP